MDARNDWPCCASLFAWFGIDLISRSQFSNLLPILVLALGIDDSLHALHRYKEERNLGKSTTEAGKITVTRVGRAIMLTSLTTMAAFSANLFSDVAALEIFRNRSRIRSTCCILANRYLGTIG